MRGCGVGGVLLVSSSRWSTAEQDKYNHNAGNGSENEIGGVVAHANKEDEHDRMDNGEHDGPDNPEEDEGEHDPPTNDVRENKDVDKLVYPIESTSRKR